MAACSRTNPEFGLDGAGSGDDAAAGGDAAITTSGAGSDASPSAGSGNASGTGDDATGGSTAAGTTAVGSTTGGTPPMICDEDSECIAVPDDDWFGPVLLRTVDTALGVEPCPNERYPTHLLDGHTGPIAQNGQIQCCSCTPGAVDCEPPVANAYSDAECTTDAGEPFADDCAPWGNSGRYFSPYSTSIANVECVAEPQIIPPPSVVGEVAACIPGKDGATCEGGVCVPDPGDGQVQRCIAHGGEVLCPAGWGNPTLVKSFEDNRVCAGACSCGGDSSYCVGSLDVYTDELCSVLSASFEQGDDGCYTDTPVGKGLHASVSVFGVAAECLPAVVGVDGQVEETVELTVCCTRNERD